MGVSLAVGSPKIKHSFRLSRTDRRLVGWVKMRVSKSSKPWIHLCLPTFCKFTGVGLRTAKRSLQKIRNSPETEIVARTINENRRWKILVSTTTRLTGLKRSEPFVFTTGTQRRRVKTQIRGEEIKVEQLVLSADPIHWRAKPNDRSEDEEQATHNPLPEHPDQKILDLDGENKSQKRECHFWDRVTKGVFPKEKQRTKHDKVESDLRIRRLAFVIARNDLRKLHWDNCKCRHTMQHSFNYAFRELKHGCNRRTIVKAYDMALEEVHAIAVDQMVTEPGAWIPSSVVSRAGRILLDGGCRGKWWSRTTNKSKKVIVTA